jgi:hypothetical protein
MKGLEHKFLSNFAQAASTSGGQTATVVVDRVIAALECKVVAIVLSTEAELVVGRSDVATRQPVHFTGHNRLTSLPMNAFEHNSFVYAAQTSASEWHAILTVVWAVDTNVAVLLTEFELVVGCSDVATRQPVHFTGHNRVTSMPMNAFVQNSFV